MIGAMSSWAMSHSGALDESRELDRAVPAMDEEEFRRFYERTARPLWAYLSRTLRDPQEADDLLQESYYRFYRAGATHSSESHRRNSLFLIATNLMRDRSRRARHQQALVLPDNVSTKVAANDDLPKRDREHAAILRTDLARALVQIEPVQRQMLWLAYAQGASHAEIAQLLGLRAGSIRTTLLRARRKLAAILATGQEAERPESSR
jgi:RNA polymerase sigma-70 factor (ECF subfamily)